MHLIAYIVITTWTSSYSSAQEESDNLCFIAVDPCKDTYTKLWVFVYITSKWLYVINFSPWILSLNAVKKAKLTQKSILRFMAGTMAKIVAPYHNLFVSYCKRLSSYPILSVQIDCSVVATVTPIVIGIWTETLPVGTLSYVCR